MTESIVQIVHCIDTEGPLHESLSATFERLRELFGLELEPRAETLRQLQNGELDLGGIEAQVAKVVAPALLDLNSSWDRIDAMLDRMMSAEYRNLMLDSFGGGWVYNWHCVDHVGYELNPRRRDLGFHNVFDTYVQRLRDNGPAGARDGLHFHHHPMPFNRQAHRSATHYFSHAPLVFETLARRIIDRQWFPSCYRPGFHAERPDSHWLLEQFIPFDLANQATAADDSHQSDKAGGRFGDWRRAPRHWAPYHPSHDDYQLPGDCRRWIARCLNVGTRHSLLTQADVDQAFSEAGAGKPVVLAFANHEFRNMEPDVANVRAMVAAASARHPGVPFRFAESRQAMRDALGLNERPPIRFQVALDGNVVHVFADAPTFGPQPFLALKTRSGAYFHDNLDFQEPFRRWTYVLDDNTFPPHALEAVGLGTCDGTGNVTVAVLDPATGRLTQVHH